MPILSSPRFQPRCGDDGARKATPDDPCGDDPSEILQACRLGVDLLKLFPANSLGVDYMKEVLGPLDNLSMIPVGGITLENTREFAKAGAFAMGVGSALTNKQWIEAGNWAAITQQAQAFIQAFHEGKRS